MYFVLFLRFTQIFASMPVVYLYHHALTALLPVHFFFFQIRNSKNNHKSKVGDLSLGSFLTVEVETKEHRGLRRTIIPWVFIT